MFVFQVFLRLISTIVLTRLLAPEVFGVFAVVMTFIYILEMFSDIGVRSLILTKEGEVDTGFLRSCWTAQILRGVLLAAICGLLALGLAWGQAADLFGVDTSYAAPVLPAAVAAIGMTSVINGFASPAKFLYEREMRFRQVSLATLIIAVLTVSTTIVLAVYLENIWALVLGNLAGALVALVLSFVMFRGPPMRPNWRTEHMRLIIERGKWIVGHSALTAVMGVADRFVLGLAIPASGFGFYYIARQIVDMVEGFLQTIHAQMGLQVFTELQRDGEAEGFRRRYYRYRLAFDVLAFFGAGMLLTVAPLMVEIIYDDRYGRVAGIIQILAPGLLLIGPGLLREAYSAQRRFREMTLLSLLRALSIWIGLAVAVIVFDSVTAALAVIALHRIPEVAVLLFIGHRRGWVDVWREVRLLPLVPAGALAGLGVTWLWQAAAG